MQSKLMWGMLLTAVMAGMALYTGNALATPASGFSGATIAQGRFAEIDVFNHFVPLDKGDVEEHKSNKWLSFQKTKGLSDLYVQSNVWAPGGSTGWHTHPGHSLIIVTEGAVTVYEGNDPECKPHLYEKGMGFVDPGGDHVHIIRNESGVEARTVAVQLIPADEARRVDAEAPGSCPF